MVRRTAVIPGHILAWGFCVLAAAAPAIAQDSPSMTIDGFRGLAWGTSPAEIVSKFGEPAENRRIDDGLLMLAYRDSLEGRPSVILFGLLDDAGLVKGQEVVDAGEGDSCITYIRAVHRTVDLRYPLIRPKEEAKNNTGDAICEAAAGGMAFWHRQWRDEATGSIVTVSLDSGADQVNLIYESKAFRDWLLSSGAGATVVPDSGGTAGDER